MPKPIYSPIHTHTSSLQIPIKDKVQFVYLEESWIDELGSELACLFGLITALSVKKGYCFMSDQGFALRRKWSLSKVKRSLKELEDRRYIYRNTYNTPKGRTRHIVARGRYMEYFDNYLSKASIPIHVREHFRDTCFPLNPPPKSCSEVSVSQGSNLTPPPMQGSNLTPYARVSPEPCLLLTNRENIKENNIKVAVSSSFEDDLKTAFDKANLGEDSFQLAKRYLADHPELIKKADNPIGWLRAGAQDGWLGEMVTNPSKPADRKLKVFELHKNIGEEIEAKYKTVAKPHGLRIDALNKQLEFVLTQGQFPPVVLPYDEPTFEIRLDKTLKKFKLGGKSP